MNNSKSHVKGMTACRVPEDDCISRQAAIDHWRLIIDSTNEDSRYNMGFVDGLEFCINHLITMPSAQTEKRTEERTETHGVCLDAISRQADIDAIENTKEVAR